MSLIHEHSTECLRSDLDLFTIPPSQTSVESGQWVEHGPLSTISQGTSTVEFFVSGNSEEYIDLSNTFLYVEARVFTDADVAIKDANKVGPVNNFMHSLFSQVDVSLNEVLVSASTNTYPYRAIIENLLNYGSDAKEGKLGAAMFSKDSADHMDATDVTTGWNVGLVKRSKFLAGGKIVDMVGPIHADIFLQNRYLLNGVSMRVRLNRSSDAFCLMSGEEGAKYKVNLVNVKLFMRKVKLTPSLVLAHEKMLQSNTAKYPITRVECKVNTLSQGIMDYSHDFNMSQVPKRVILTFVDNRAFNGSISKNPFNFQTFELEHLALYLGKDQIPWSPLTPSFNLGRAIRSYYTQYTGGDGILSDTGHDISRGEFGTGYALYCFDLTPDLSSSCGQYVNLVKQGTLRVSAKFDSGLPNTVNMIVYCEFDNLIEINKDRQVIHDYKS